MIATTMASEGQYLPLPFLFPSLLASSLHPAPVRRSQFLAVTSWDNSCSVYNYQVSRWQLHALSVAVSEEEWS